MEVYDVRELTTKNKVGVSWTCIGLWLEWWSICRLQQRIRSSSWTSATKTRVISPGAAAAARTYIKLKGTHVHDIQEN
jgi:hypothetical protein